MSKVPKNMKDNVLLKPFEKANTKEANKIITLIALHPSTIRAAYFSL